jgi:hypothetical protein
MCPASALLAWQPLVEERDHIKGLLGFYKSSPVLATIRLALGEPWLQQ